MERIDSGQSSLFEIKPSRRGFLNLAGVIISATLLGCRAQASSNTGKETPNADLTNKIEIPNFNSQDLMIYNGTLLILFDTGEFPLPRLRYNPRLEGTETDSASNNLIGISTSTGNRIIRHAEINFPIIVSGGNENPESKSGLWLATDGLVRHYTSDSDQGEKIWSFIMINPTDHSTDKYLSWTPKAAKKYISLDEAHRAYNPSTGFFIPRSQIDVVSTIN